MPVCISTQGWWKLGETVMWVHLNAVILTTAHVWWLECAVESWAVECEQLVEAVAKTFECTTAAINSTIGIASFAAILVCFTNDLLRDFNKTVENVAQGAAQLTGRSVVGSGRVLNVSHGTCGGDNEGCCDRKCFFHRESILASKSWCGNGKMDFFKILVSVGVNQFESRYWRKALT